MLMLGRSVLQRNTALSELKAMVISALGTEQSHLGRGIVK